MGTGAGSAWRGLSGSSVVGVIDGKDSTRPADLRVQAVATILPHIAVRIQRGGGTGPLKPRQPSRASGKRWQFHQAPNEGLGDAVRASPSRSLRRNSPGGGFLHMPADALKCKECSTTYPLDARYVCERCFGPLEVAYTRADGRRRRRAQAPHPGRAAHALALRRLPAARGRCARRAADGLDAARAGRPARRALGLARAVGQERDREPDALVQGPRRLRRAGARPRARLRHARLRLDRQPRQRRRRARRRRRACASYVFIPADLERARSSPPASTARNIVAIERQLRRRQPPVHRARGRARGRGRS